MKQLEVAADVKQLDSVQDFVREQLEAYDVDPKVMFQLELAVDEIFTNISSYAYNPIVGQATINCYVEDDPLRVTIQFMDHGKPFDPLAGEDADTSEEALMSREGGLGILLVKNIMDDVQYSYEDGRNILTIVKKL